LNLYGPSEFMNGQVAQAVLLTAVAVAVLIAAAACAFWAGAQVTGVLQCVFIVCVVMLSASVVADYKQSGG
jgi:hypothetical protein